MFINKNDSLRKEYGIGKKPVQSVLSVRRFAFPMPAMGELLCKIREKRPGDYKDSVDELFKLIDSGFIDVRYISNADDVFGMAKAIVSKRCDPRDRISPMDALIIATAAANQDCEVFYSADSKLIADVDTHNIVNDCRKGLGFDPMSVNDISDILKV